MVQVTQMSNGHRVKSQMVVVLSKRSQYVTGMEQKSQNRMINNIKIHNSLGIVALSTECIVWSQIKFGDMFLQKTKLNFMHFLEASSLIVHWQKHQEWISFLTILSFKIMSWSFIMELFKRTTFLYSDLWCYIAL